jgi:hypothetical protein
LRGGRLAPAYGDTRLCVDKFKKNKDLYLYFRLAETPFQRVK